LSRAPPPIIQNFSSGSEIHAPPLKQTYAYIMEDVMVPASCTENDASRPFFVWRHMSDK